MVIIYLNKSGLLIASNTVLIDLIPACLSTIIERTESIFRGTNMLKLTPSGLRWLKGLHLITVSCWIGGAMSLLLLYLLKNGITEGSELHMIDRCIHHVDIMVIVIPGGFGCVITGLIYSLFTNYGFFRHKWLTVKWILTIAAILSGTFFLGPWETAMMEISGKLGISALSSSEYIYNQKMNIIFGGIQTLVLIITVFISVFKPWKRK